MDLLHDELMEPVENLSGEVSDDEDEEDGEEGSHENISSTAKMESEAASPLSSDAEPEEYETADSGVSDQSSNEDDEANSGKVKAYAATLNRKRKRSGNVLSPGKILTTT